jgi:hypothetical protein
MRKPTFVHRRLCGLGRETAGCGPGVVSSAQDGAVSRSHLRLPLLTTRLTLPPLGRTAPSPGFCQITRPRLTSSSSCARPSRHGS